MFFFRLLNSYKIHLHDSNTKILVASWIMITYYYYVLFIMTFSNHLSTEINFPSEKYNKKKPKTILCYVQWLWRKKLYIKYINLFIPFSWVKYGFFLGMFLHLLNLYFPFNSIEAFISFLYFRLMVGTLLVSG